MSVGILIPALVCAAGIALFSRFRNDCDAEHKNKNAITTFAVSAALVYATLYIVTDASGGASSLNNEAIYNIQLGEPDF